MAYLGNSFNTQAVQPATDFFSGNGVTTTFTLSRPIQSTYNIEVVVNNVQQNPSSFSISGTNQLVLSAAPSAGTNNIYVMYNAIVSQQGTVGQGVVGTPQLGSVSNINSIGSNLTLQTNSTTALTVDQNGRLIASVGYGFSGGAGFERFVGKVDFANGVSNLATNIQLGNISTGGMFEVSITSSYNYQNSAGGIRKVFSILVNPSNQIYSNESRVSHAIGQIVTNFSIGEFQWDNASSQYIIPISHLVSTANTIFVFIKLISPGNADSAFTGATLSSTYTLSPLSRNYENFNNPVGFGTTQPSYPVQVVGKIGSSSIALTPTVYGGSNGNGPIGTYTIGNGKYWETGAGAIYIHIVLPARYNNTNSKMFCIEVKGYDFESARIINLMIGGYVTPVSNGGPISRVAVWDSASAYSPTAYYSSTYSAGVARFYLPSKYYCSFTVNSIASGNGDIIEPSELQILSSTSATI